MEHPKWTFDPIPPGTTERDSVSEEFFANGTRLSAIKPVATDPNCAYCAEGAPLDAFGIKIRELPASKLYLFKEQSHRGRVIVASKFHVSEMVDLPDGDRCAFLDDVAHVARALHKAFAPKKVNYGAYGDTGCHLHFHLVPKYEGGFEFGGVFEMNPKRTFLQPAEYDALIAAIKAAL